MIFFYQIHKIRTLPE